MIREEAGTHFEGDKKYFIDGPVTYKELAELIILFGRNEDNRKILYENKENYLGKTMLYKFLDEALSKNEVPIPQYLLTKYKL
jgi:hypothetical protein